MTNKDAQLTDIAIIGAGPAGSVSAALLRKKGYNVICLERQHFPRFSIGESLLPQCMMFLEEAGMVDAVNNAGFRFKNGAAFARGDERSHYYFPDKFSPGPGTTFQVERGRFDQILATDAAEKGADIRFGHSVRSAICNSDGIELEVSTDKDQQYTLKAKYLLDASGFGRVLPRLLDLELPSDFPSRTSLFTHIDDGIEAGAFDRDKILISVHPDKKDIWYWLIPFENGRCSLGVVAEDARFQEYQHLTEKERLKTLVNEAPNLKALLANANFDTDVRQITGYACDVKSLYGENFALLGNAGEFLDPVFSSGVTIAMKSASLIAPLVDRHLKGESVDWQREYAEPLKVGVDTFRVYVDAWYDTRFQEVIFSAEESDEVRRMISSILAGYAWDQNNPLVAKAKRRLNAIYELSKEQ